MSDLRDRLKNRVHLTTDGLGIDALLRDGIDYAVMQKTYGSPVDDERRYSPAGCTGVDVRIVSGDPDRSKIGTSYIERSNLTLRMGSRRYTRLTNAFSKRIEQHAAAVAGHHAYHNLARPHMTLSRKAGKPTTPAMAAGIERARGRCLRSRSYLTSASGMSGVGLIPNCDPRRINGKVSMRC